MTEFAGNTTWDTVLEAFMETLNATTESPTTPDIVTAPAVDPVGGDLSLVINDSITNLNISAVEYVPVAAAGIAFTTLVVVGSLSIISFVSTLIYGRKRINEFPFFVIVYHMTVANALWVAMCASSILPIMIADGSDGAGDWYMWAARIMDVADNALLYLTLLMTLNRLCVFCFPKLIFVFTKFKLMIMCCLVWVYVLCIVWWNVEKGVVNKWDVKKLSVQQTILGSNPLTQFFTVCSTVVPLVMLLLYGIIVFVIMKQRGKSSSTRKRQDRVLLWQALAITCTLELSKLFSLLTPLIAVSTWFAWVWTIFNYSCSIINQILNPVLFLTMNQMIRNTFLKMISLGHWKFDSSVDSTSKRPKIFVAPTTKTGA